MRLLFFFCPVEIAFACFVCLKKEKPDANMEDLVKEADEIVSQEMKDRQKQREEAAASTEATIEESKDEGEPEVSSK